MTSVIGNVPEGELNAEQLAATFARRRAMRDEFSGEQLAAMDALWRAQRAGEVTSDDAQQIETTIRRGHVHGARKRLTRARRRITSASE